MFSTSSREALQFVQDVELPQPLEGQAVEAAAQFDFDKAKDQAVIVGSDIISFVKGVTEQRRQDLVNSALLAQLVANKKVTNPSHVFSWYGAYFDALTNIGWLVQDKQFIDHIESSSSLEAHKAIISLATTLLGPQAAALQVVKATLDALQKMDESSPWITLFNRESKFAKTARFQVTLAEEAPDSQFLVTLMAFGLVAESTLTQVLMFGLSTRQARLRSTPWC
jgi:hypothetical protein